MSAPTFQSAPSLPTELVDSSFPPFWGRIETLWLWMPALCALLYTLCLPLAPNDLWYHVRAGELISRGTIPTQNLMSSGIPVDAPYYYQSWLAELFLFWTLKLGGLSGLALLRAFCVSGTFLLVTVACFRSLLRLEKPPSRLLAARITALGAVVGLAMASNNVDLRPQTFSLLFLGAWIFGVFEWRATQARKRAVWSVFLVLLTCLWANTHGAFIVSVLGLFSLAVADFLARRELFKPSLSLALTSGAAALINPRGAALYSYVAGLSRDEISQKFVQEWKSPGLEEWHSVLFWICAAGTLAALLATNRRWTAEKETQSSGKWSLFFPALLFFTMAARDQRSILWFALWFVPCFGALICHFLRGTAQKATPIPAAAQILNAVLMALLILGPLALFPCFKASWPWPREFARRFAPTPVLFSPAPPLLLENTTPVVATQFLLQHPPRGRLFTDMVCGSYLTYAGRGQIRPSCDPRIEMFPVKFWQDYLKLSTGPPDAVGTLQNRGFTDVLLDKQNMPALVERFRQNPTWKLVASNGTTQLFRLSNQQKL